MDNALAHISQKVAFDSTVRSFDIQTVEQGFFWGSDLQV